MTDTIQLISALAGVLLSLAFSYLPGLDTWYARQTGQEKRLLMLIVLALSGLLIWGAGCSGLWGTCQDWREIVRALLVLVAANQSAFLLSPQSGRAREAWLSGIISRDGDLK